MKIIKSYAKIVGLCGLPFARDEAKTLLRHIEWAGRVSHRSEDVQTSDSYDKFLRTVVLGHGDWSITEHVSITVEAVVDRGVTHEWVRHRLGAYTQESTRFVNYEKRIPPAFIYPKPEIECERCLGGSSVYVMTGFLGDPQERKWVHREDSNEVPCAYSSDWLDSVAQAEESYRRLLKQGWRPQEARSVFPNALAAKLIVTYNPRMWRHFFIMRTSAEAHPQMRQVTIPLLAQFQEHFPMFFEDVVPNTKQSIAMKTAR